MKQFWASFFGALGGIVAAAGLALLAAVFLAGDVVTSTVRSAPAVRSESPVVLEIDLRAAQPAGPSRSALALALDHAAADPRIEAVFVRAAPALDPAFAAELHAALARLSDAGKPVGAHAQGFAGPLAGGYAAVSGADRLWLQSTARFDVETPASPRGAGISLHDQALRRLAADRGITVDSAGAALARAPLTAEAALEAGLADSVGQVWDARAESLAATEGGVVVSMTEYAAQIRGGSRPTLIALIDAQGALEATADPVTAALEDAVRAENVRAAVLRLDSPGGSVTGAEEIHGAVLRARRAGLPVVVSIAGAATEAGYVAAVAADRIVASPASLVAVMAPPAGVGISAEPVGAPGEEASRALHAARFEQARYAQVLDLIAAGRDLPPARIEALSAGRVWTGAQALDLGLVDRTGGLAAAVEEARTLAGLTSDEAVSVTPFPTGSAPLERWRTAVSLISAPQPPAEQARP